MKMSLLRSVVLAVCVVVSAQASAGLVITGVFDGPLSGGLPKVVELYATADSDLSQYAVGAANNGGGTDGVELPLSGSATAGDFIYVADTGNSFDATLFSNYFGVTPAFLFDGNFNNGGAAAINGDDAIELFSDPTGMFTGSETVVDVFGELSGGFDSYADGWAYRVDGTGPDGSTFVPTNWTFSGTDVNDGVTSNASANVPFPAGTYTAIPEPASLALLLLSSLAAVGIRRR